MIISLLGAPSTLLSDFHLSRDWSANLGTGEFRSGGGVELELELEENECVLIVRVIRIVGWARAEGWAHRQSEKVLPGSVPSA